MIATAVIGLAVGGCGEGEAESGISRADFVRQANAICAATSKKIDAAREKAFLEEAEGKENATSLPLTRHIEVPIIQAEIDDLRDLAAPLGDRAQVEAILASFQAVVDKVKNHPVEVLHSADNQYENAEKLATGYGLAACPLT